jgi:hypothetical protein
MLNFLILQQNQGDSNSRYNTNSKEANNRRDASNSSDANNSRDASAENIAIARTPRKFTAERTTETDGPTETQETSGTSGDAYSRDIRTGGNNINGRDVNC